MKKLFLMLLIFLNISALTEKPIVVIITSFNNAKWYQKNLDSVYNQKYHNYRVIYIDDHSKDNTGKLVENYLKTKNLTHKTILIQNKEWKSQMYNHYRAVHMCKDHEIVVHLDGDDWLANDQVLQKVNNAYSTEGIWLTYGGLKNWPQGNDSWLEYAKNTPKELIKTNNFRDTWLYSHLRSFYAGLFKKIKLQDLIYESSFKLISPTPDTAFMYPMLEMAGERIKCFHETVYVRNAVNPISQRKINNKNQKKVSFAIKKWKKYTRLESLNAEKSATDKADCIIIADKQDNSNLIQNIKNQISGINNIFVYNKSDVNSKLSDVLQKCGEYTLLLTTDSNLNQKIDIPRSIKKLDKTHAFGFYFGIHKKDFNNTNFITLPDNATHGWQFSDSKDLKLKNILNFNLTLYRTHSLIKLLLTKNYKNDDFIKRKLGLFTN